jgi:hypothetical protein
MRTLHSRLSGTLYEAWYNSKPYYRHLRTPGIKCCFLERLRNKQTDNFIEAILLGYEEDYIYRLLTKSGSIVRASTVTFAAEKRHLEDVEDVGDTSPAKRSCNQPVLDLWGAGANIDTITQDILGIDDRDISATDDREPNARETPINTIVQESLSHLRQSLS